MQIILYPPKTCRHSVMGTRMHESAVELKQEMVIYDYKITLGIDSHTADFPGTAKE